MKRPDFAVDPEPGASIGYYRLVPDNLTNTLNGFVQEVCPVSRPLKRKSAARKREADGEDA